MHDREHIPERRGRHASTSLTAPVSPWLILWRGVPHSLVCWNSDERIICYTYEGDTQRDHTVRSDHWNLIQSNIKTTRVSTHGGDNTTTLLFKQITFLTLQCWNTHHKQCIWSLDWQIKLCRLFLIFLSNQFSQITSLRLTDWLIEN